MRFSLTILFAASLVSAVAVRKRQNDVIPACASTCASQLSFSPCQDGDIACQCFNTNYTGPLTTCIQQTCTQQDAAQAGQVATAQCKAAGVDFTLNNGNPAPPCAVTCDGETPSSCTATDTACLCKDTTYVGQLYSCIRTYCSGQDLTTAHLVGKAQCRAYGVDISPSVGA